MRSQATKGAPLGRAFQLPETISPAGASARAKIMLNGRSSGSTAVWDCSAGDYILAQVRDISFFQRRFDHRKVARYELLVEEGSEAGRPIPMHAHRILACIHEELHRMHARLEPRVGDLLCVAYLGRDDSRRPARHLYRYSIERAEVRSGDTHEL
jgi:hypothetical protein